MIRVYGPGGQHYGSPTSSNIEKWAPIKGISPLFGFADHAHHSALLRNSGETGISVNMQDRPCNYRLITMGWLSLPSRLHEPSFSHQVHTEVTDLKASTEHFEHIERVGDIYDKPGSFAYPLQDSSVPDDALPFIPPAVVRDQRLLFSQNRGYAWIVVENIVYDCTNFIEEHPGGDTVIRSFVGEDCSWQFWRFHSKAVMNQWGRPLRVGRTQGIDNRFKEPPRYFGSWKNR